MKLLKRNKFDLTIRKVYSDDKSVLYGIVGQLWELVDDGLLVHVSRNGERPLFVSKQWVFIPACRSGLKYKQGETRQSVLTDIYNKEVILNEVL